MQSPQQISFPVRRNSFPVGKIQIKTSELSYHLTRDGMSQINNSWRKRHWQGCGEEEHSYTVGGIASWSSHTGKQCGSSTKIVKNRAALWPSSCNTKVSKGTSIEFWKGNMHCSVSTATSTIAKLWAEPRCPMTDEWIKKKWYTYTMRYYSVSERKEILPFAMMWMELEGIMLRGVSQSENDIWSYDFTHMWNLRIKTDEHGETEGEIK